MSFTSHLIDNNKTKYRNDYTIEMYTSPIKPVNDGDIYLFHYNYNISSSSSLTSTIKISVNGSAYMPVIINAPSHTGQNKLRNMILKDVVNYALFCGIVKVNSSWSLSSSVPSHFKNNNSGNANGTTISDGTPSNGVIWAD